MDATWRAASTTFGLFGRTMTSRALTALDRAEQLARARVGRLTAVHHAGDPEVAEDRRQPVARRDGEDAQGRQIDGPGRAVGARPRVAGAASLATPVNSAAFDLADVPRLVVEVLDADPAQACPSSARSR